MIKLIQKTDITSYVNPGKVIIGIGSISSICEQFASNDKPLIVSDPGVAQTGAVSVLEKIICDQGFKCSVFDRIVSDPPIKLIEEVIKYYKNESCTTIIGLGGGSSIDASKAVALAVSTGEDLRSYRDRHPVTQQLTVPLIAIPTTAGTGSEVTGTSVISDPERKMKLPIIGVPLVPRIAILDGNLLIGIPSHIAAVTGTDALIHAIEAFISKKANPITDTLAYGAIKMLVENIRNAVADNQNVEVLQNMLIGCYISGMSFANAGLGLVHSLAHPLGAYYHIPHGFACAVSLLPVLEYNYPVCVNKFALLSQAFGYNYTFESKHVSAKRFIDGVSLLLKDLNIPSSLSEYGVNNYVVEEQMVEDAFASGPARINPRKATKDEIRSLFQKIA